MLRVLTYLLPVLLPSWRFFKTIAPSPRIEWTEVTGPEVPPLVWHPFRPAPNRLTWPALLRRLLFSPTRNEDLYLITCAERIQDQPDAHSIGVIIRSIQREALFAKDRLRFQLVFVHRDGTGLSRQVTFQSDPFPAVAQ